MMQRPAVFLDRDGTINYNVNYCRTLDEFHLLPEAATAIRTLNSAGFLVVVITNQSGVARGLFSEKTLGEIHEYMQLKLVDTGARIDRIYYCPHRAEDDCMCRKPRPGLLLQASAELGISLDRSVMVGDSESDVEAGMSAGCRTVMLNNEWSPMGTTVRLADYETNSITDAVAWILRNP
jgi:D,D-heptose 1,7-bisphosphate phosphatase